MPEAQSFDERPLKKVTLQNLEAAMADAVSELAGERYIASVVRFDLEPSTMYRKVLRPSLDMYAADEGPRKGVITH